MKVKDAGMKEEVSRSGNKRERRKIEGRAGDPKHEKRDQGKLWGLRGFELFCMVSWWFCIERE